MTQKTKIDERFLQFPDLVEARNRAENALIAYEKAGGSVRCCNNGYGPYHLCVNVKDRKMRKCTPEIREDHEQEFYDMQARDFWEFDFDGDCIAPEHCVHQFPEFFSEGRNSGYFVFDGLESKRGGPAFSAYNQKSNWHGGSQEPTPEGTLDTALAAFDDTVDPFSWIEDVRDFGDDEKKRKAFIEEDVANLTQAYINMAEVFESAKEWVEVVLATMEYRGENYEGKHKEELDRLADNEMFSFFDFTSVHVEIDGEECTVSWPQHARQFKDCGKWVECKPEDEGAQEWGTPESKPPGTKVFKKFVPAPASVFSIKMDREQLAEILNEDMAAAVKTIRSRALKSLTKKGK